MITAGQSWGIAAGLEAQVPDPTATYPESVAATDLSTPDRTCMSVTRSQAFPLSVVVIHAAGWQAPPRVQVDPTATIPEGPATMSLMPPVAGSSIVSMNPPTSKTGVCGTRVHVRPSVEVQTAARALAVAKPSAVPSQSLRSSPTRISCWPSQATALTRMDVALPSGFRSQVTPSGDNQVVASMVGSAAYPMATKPDTPRATSNMPISGPLDEKLHPVLVAADPGTRSQVLPSADLQMMPSQVPDAPSC